jgi:hypothetical protein
MYRYFMQENANWLWGVMLNCKGNTDCKIPADARFMRDKATSVAASKLIGNCPRDVNYFQ